MRGTALQGDGDEGNGATPTQDIETRAAGAWGRGTLRAAVGLQQARALCASPLCTDMGCPVLALLQPWHRPAVQNTMSSQHAVGLAGCGSKALLTCWADLPAALGRRGSQPLARSKAAISTWPRSLAWRKAAHLRGSKFGRTRVARPRRTPDARGQVCLLQACAVERSNSALLVAGDLMEWCLAAAVEGVRVHGPAQEAA